MSFTTRLFSVAMAFAVTPVAWGSPCDEFATEVENWMARSGNVLRTTITAAIDGGLYQGFTFVSYRPATMGRFALPASLSSSRTPLSVVGSSTPALEISFRLTFGTFALASRNLTAGARIDVGAIETCERIPSVGGWRLVSGGAGEANQYLFEMGFDSVPR